MANRAVPSAGEGAIGDGGLSAPTTPRIMGILNVTPDSFSDGGRFRDFDAAIAHAREMVAAGASIIDIGGESTRPGARPTTAADEAARVLPLVEALGDQVDATLSIDTSKPGVMRDALRAGAGMINDVNALRAPGALAVAAEFDVPVCLMHMRGEPRTMQMTPRYEDVVAEVRAFLLERVAACHRHGIDAQRLILDPGFGFGKTIEHNLCLLASLDVLVATGFRVLVGLSRKSMIGAITGRAVNERATSSVVLALAAARKGAAILRVHDVAITVDALRLTQRLDDYEKGAMGT